MPYRLTGGIQHYAWGSRTELAQLRGEAASERPEAELWFGTHPALPSQIEIDGRHTPLREWLATRHLSDLPFLFKILAAEQPLSIQTHPSKAQAERGFARDQAAGLGLTAANRNYRDANHKPELICALGEFEALCGFRPANEALALISALHVPELQPVVEHLAAGELHAAFEWLLRAEKSQQAKWVGAAEHAARALTSRDEYRWVVELARLYPGDAGVVISLLLNYVRLQRGEALYLPAGNLHAYLRGTGVEVMAASDNVLRGGLTPKHVDIDELLAVTVVEALRPPHLVPPVDERGVSVYVSPFAEFQLQRLDSTEGVPVRGPALVWCEHGVTHCGEVALHACEAGLIAADESVVVSNHGCEWVVVVP